MIDLNLRKENFRMLKELQSLNLHIKNIQKDINEENSRSTFIGKQIHLRQEEKEDA